MGQQLAPKLLRGRMRSKAPGAIQRAMELVPGSHAHSTPAAPTSGSRVHTSGPPDRSPTALHDGVH